MTTSPAFGIAAPVRTLPRTAAEAREFVLRENDSNRKRQDAKLRGQQALTRELEHRCDQAALAGPINAVPRPAHSSAVACWRGIKSGHSLRTRGEAAETPTCPDCGGQLTCAECAKKAQGDQAQSRGWSRVCHGLRAQRVGGGR